MNEVHDLIYAGEHQHEIQRMIREAFPDAEFEEASDFIHHGEFSVTIPNVRQNRFLIWLCANGLLNSSFTIGLGIELQPLHFNRIFKAALRLQRIMKERQEEDRS